VTVIREMFLFCRRVGWDRSVDRLLLAAQPKKSCRKKTRRDIQNVVMEKVSTFFAASPLVNPAIPFYVAEAESLHQFRN